MKTKIQVVQESTQFDGVITTLVEFPDGTPDSHITSMVNAVTRAVEEGCKRIETLGEAITAIAGGHAAKFNGPGRPARPLYVTFIDPTVMAPSGVDAGKTYGSTRELSQLLGYPYNACGAALSRARGYFKKEATLRGVTFQFVDDIDVSV